MAGRGPSPKSPERRVRKTRTVGDFQVIEIEPAVQPELKKILGTRNPAVGMPWRAGTLHLWDALGDHPTTQGLTEAQWMLLARAMIIDDLVLRGEVKLSQELRLQLGKFFIAPDDVLRGRFSFAQADEAEDRVRRRRDSLGSSSRDRRGPLVG